MRRWPAADPEPFIDALEAARFCGYRPGSGRRRDDPAIRAFYEFVRRHEIPKHHRGRSLLFLKSELSAALARSKPEAAVPDNETPFERMERLAKAHAAGERVHG